MCEDKCHGNGFCNVYDQTFSKKGDPPGYERRKGTEWCKCPVSKLFLPCPNAALCGNHTYPTWVMGCRHGRCTTCDTSIGGDLQFQHNLENWECVICMELKPTSCVFPDCSSRHAFCLECTKKVIWGVPNPRYNPDDSEDSECELEGGTNACPMCRHEFDWTKDWSATDRVPMHKRQKTL